MGTIKFSPGRLAGGFSLGLVEGLGTGRGLMSTERELGTGSGELKGRLQHLGWKEGIQTRTVMETSPWLVWLRWLEHHSVTWKVTCSIPGRAAH